MNRPAGGPALENAERLRRGLGQLGLSTPGFGPIVPWIVGGAQRAQAIARALQEQGLRVIAIRPPSVPMGSARLRLTVSAGHSKEAIDQLLTAIGALLFAGALPD